MDRNELKIKALDYHKYPKPGKLNIDSSKPVATQSDLTLAYSPGVAYPCLEIKDDPEKIYEYTSRSNTVAVITDGTAVLGLGNIGPHASMPVMEGKCVLLKKFADINGIPIAIRNCETTEEFAKIAASLDVSFGAINLEDIKAPECFAVESELKKLAKIPVFHDDQHGTAIISLAGIITSCKLTNRNLNEIKIVINGSGAAGLACADHYVAAGIPKSHITIVDSNGVIFTGRTIGMNEYKNKFAIETSARTLSDALVGADIFVGVSVANILTGEMIKKMSPDPIVFALANPDPEIQPSEAKAAGAIIVATGRSDNANQINNVLGFPGIFRGALDTRATEINEEMKLAATYALVELANEKMSDELQIYLHSVYPDKDLHLKFRNENPLCNELIIPKPFDYRVVPRVARKVAQAAMDSGLAKIKIDNLDEYEEKLIERLRH